VTSRDWARTTTSRAAGEIKRRRGEHTVQWLSDRTADYGHRISRSRISDLERGDRGGALGVAELIVLAAALEVPPVLLLFPGLPAEPVELIPDEPVGSWEALQWFTGEQLQAGRVSTPAANTWLLRQLRRLVELDRMYVDQVARWASLEKSGRDAKAMLRLLAERTEQTVAEEERIATELSERGVSVPDLFLKTGGETERDWYDPDATDTNR
jgi:transcriptional regulator with XRE-family HTH domain